MAKKLIDGTATVVATTAAGEPSRTRGLRPGDPTIGRMRRPPLPERVGTLAGGLLGEEVGALIYAVVESVRRQQMPASIANELLRRVLPERPPADVGTLPPTIRSASDWAAAVAELYRLRREGLITDDEYRKLQAAVRETWEAVREARVFACLGE